MTLQEIRKNSNLTQKEAALLIGVPYRTYVRYEENESYVNSYKYNKFISDLLAKTKVDEEHGILTINEIRDIVADVLFQYGINYCYLFGSYARDEARENSDVDLLIDTDMTGLSFFELVEELRTKLHKKVDLLRLNDLDVNNPIVLEILREGVRLL